MSWPQDKNAGRLPDERPVECPSCHGSCQAFAFVDYADGSGSSGWGPCSHCNGTGSITAKQAKREIAGRLLRDERVRRHIALTVAAAAFETTPQELSQAEHGRIDPAPFFDRMLDVYARVP